jgi:hypothetical protein
MPFTSTGKSLAVGHYTTLPIYVYSIAPSRSTTVVLHLRDFPLKIILVAVYYECPIVDKINPLFEHQ